MVGPKGFGYEVVSPFLHTFHRTFHRAVPGDNDHRNIGVALTNHLQHFKGSHNRHLQVTKNDVGGLAIQHFQSVPAVFGGQHLEPLRAEDTATAVSDHFFIVYHKESGLCRHIRSFFTRLRRNRSPRP